VGPSGCGKSTIFRLLFRFYDVSSGSILVDGEDIRNVSLSSLRKAIGVIPQDCVLFNDTLGYNVRYGKEHATDVQVDQAIRMAAVDSIVKQLPQGLDTKVGERGLKLSGGEKQRVAIARTALKESRVLLCDEATSALDSASEAHILRALNSVSKGQSSIIIAHRLSTVVNADRIIVLNEGRVIESGAHAQLLAKGGVYASMWQQQAHAPQEAEETREDEESVTPKH